MKLAIALRRLFVCLVITLAACDQGSNEVTARLDAARPARSDLSWRERASALRDRADAAFAAQGAPAIRHETRVGPQPWPEDLPSRWPLFAEATVVADTLRGEGDRLLLVNWPGSPAEAIDSYQAALAERGYRVDRPRLRRDRHALHAQSGEHEAVLTFISRDHVTRVEILFLARGTG
jgi:hypothetical protein